MSAGVLNTEFKSRPATGWRGSWRARKGHAHASRVRAALFVLVCVVNFVSQSGAQEGRAGEYQVKAAFLFHFAQFVEWPAQSFKDASSPLTYCTLGDDPFQGALEQSLSGKMIASRPLRVEHLEAAEPAQNCQILFLGMTEKKQIAKALAGLRGAPVLTVGETDHFARDGGIIGFSLEDKKVRFEINLQAAAQANLKISSRLLALAKSVVGGPRGI